MTVDASAATKAKPAAHKKAPAKTTAIPASKFGGPKYSSIVVDADTGQVLHEANADVQSYPASLTKMMTLYLLFNALERGEVRLTTPMVVSSHAAAQAPSKLGVRPGKSITVDQAIDAIVTKSANDVAVVIGEKLAGSEEQFAEKMTAVAHKLGMSQTTFHNASGLPDPLQLSTARDMAILGKRLIQDHPEYYPLFSRMDFSYGGQQIHTHNHLLENYEGADGIKTGYTVASGYNLVSSAKRENHRIIAVVFGGATAAARDRHMVDLLDEGFAKLNGQSDTVLATAERIKEFQQVNVASATHATEEEAESAGDRDEATRQISIKTLIEASELPPAPPIPASEAQPMPAPKLAVLPARTKPVEAVMASADAAPAQPAIARAAAPMAMLASLPPSGSWGIQIGAFGSEAKATEQATAAASALKTEFSGAVPLVETATVNGAKLFRAQIHGLSKQDLIKACSLVTIQPKSTCKALAPSAKG